MAPNIDRNVAPETWITAAPQDTITTRNEFNEPVPPVVGTIPFRFHVYWAGSDEDGTVAGYYFAVVETVTTPGLPRAPLPGPKPRDYKFTTRSDSTFTFNVFEESRVREHAFFIYAVDNNGKPDPTPARFIFNALDRYPPIAVITQATGTGYMFDPKNPGAPPVLRTYAITDTFLISKPTPKDTIPSGSTVRFRWRGEESAPNNPAIRFKYKLEETQFVDVPATVDSVTYPAGSVTTGDKQFLLRAVDEPGGARSDVQANRVFRVNFSPDTWFAGPDPNAPGWSLTADGQRYRDITSWLPKPSIPGSLLSADSVVTMPKDRVPRKTFLELYKNRIYLRAENDTVDANSWVLFHSGGFDPDSPYEVRISGFSFDTTAGPVLKQQGANASPIGFRLSVPVDLYPAGPVSTLPQTTLYPLDEALTPPETHIGGYIGLQQAGRAFAVVQAVDGDGGQDRRLNPEKVPAFVDSVERGIMPSFRLPLRNLILSFYVNRAPVLLTDNGAFLPRSGAVQATRTIQLRLLSFDEDPYDPSQRLTGGPPPNQPTPQRFRYTVWLKGTLASGADTTYRPAVTGYYRSEIPPTSITVPSFMVGTNVSVEVELCDYPDDAYVPGQGRCRSYSFPVIVPPPTAPPGASATSAQSPRPGFSEFRSGGKSR